MCLVDCNFNFQTRTEMKKLILAVLLVATTQVAMASDFKQEPMCRVQACNKIERFSLSIWSHVKDSMGETCMNIIVPKSEAVVDSVLSDESRWYQGSSINPTKRSVTRIKQVLECQGN